MRNTNRGNTRTIALPNKSAKLNEHRFLYSIAQWCAFRFGDRKIPPSLTACYLYWCIRYMNINLFFFFCKVSGSFTSKNLFRFNLSLNLMAGSFFYGEFLFSLSFDPVNAAVPCLQLFLDWRRRSFVFKIKVSFAESFIPTFVGYVNCCSFIEGTMYHFSGVLL